MKTLVLCVIAQILVGSALSDEQSRQYFPEDDVNYKRFMMVQDSNGESQFIDLLSQPVTLNAQISHLSYYIYTQNNLDNPFVITDSDVNQLSKSNFSPSKRTIFIIHGWNDGYTADVNRLVKSAILKKFDVNVIVVDWSPIALENYTTAKSSVVSFGQFIGNFINDIIAKYNLDGSDFILIGHSLGAHIAGNAGSATSKPIDHIIGLDPAAPLFSVANTEERLDPSDANYVQIIHTNGRFLGFETSIGDADFYPNGGMIQVGCGLDLLGACSHARSFQFLAESIESNTPFVATACGSYDDFNKGKCNSNRKVRMSEIDVDKSVKGDFYLNTNSNAPYAIPTPL